MTLVFFRHSAEGNVVGFPKDGDQLQEMFNRMDVPQILYLAPRIYYIKNREPNKLMIPKFYNEKNPLTLKGSPDGETQIKLKE